MPELSSTNNPLTADGTYTADIIPGQFFTFTAAGTWGGGSLAIAANDENGNAIAFKDSPLTANGGFIFCAPAGIVSFTLSGATNPSLKIQLSPVA